MGLPLIIVTGLSGAGRTTVLKALEDKGFQVVDNLPFLMVPALIEYLLSHNAPEQSTAIGITSTDSDTANTKRVLSELQSNTRIEFRIIYLDCSAEKILQRYSESRRPHPIGSQNLQSAIKTEEGYLSSFKKIAEIEIDTTDLSVRHLRTILHHYFSGNPSKEKNPKILLISFSYKRAIPNFADLVFDMRFLSNPFYDINLRNLSGKHKEVQHYILQDPRWMIVEHHLKEFLINSITGYEEQGRSYLTIAFGCTGGQHRSVFSAEYFHNILKKLNYTCTIEHCELEGQN